MPGNKLEYEIAGATHWHPDPNVRGKTADYPVDTSQSDLPVWLYNGVGGSSVLYGGIWARPLPSDFAVRTLDGVADDWPMTYRELVPFYEAVEKEMGVAGLPGNPAYPPGFVPPLPPAPIHLPGRKMAEGMNRLGWHWWPGTNAIATQPYRHQSQCVRYGVCRMGCPEGAKASVDVTHLPQAVANGVRLIKGARVAEVPLDSHGRATGAVYVKDGQQHLQRASVVLMAAGGIGTPRVLLMSNSARFPDGLANTSGLVGKRLMLHPYGSAVESTTTTWRIGWGRQVSTSHRCSFTSRSRIEVSCEAQSGRFCRLQGRWRQWTSGSAMEPKAEGNFTGKGRPNGCSASSAT